MTTAYMTLQDIKIRNGNLSTSGIVRDNETGVTKIFYERGKINVIVQTINYNHSIAANIISNKWEIIPKTKDVANFSLINVHKKTGICAFNFVLKTTCQKECCTAFYLIVSYVNLENEVVYIASMPMASYSKYNIKSSQQNNEALCSFLSMHSFQSKIPINGKIDLKDGNNILVCELKRDDICYYDVTQHRDVPWFCNKSQVTIDAVTDIVAFRLSGNTLWEPPKRVAPSYTAISWIYQWIINAGDHDAVATVKVARYYSYILCEWVSNSSVIQLHSSCAARTRGQLEKKKMLN